MLNRNAIRQPICGPRGDTGNICPAHAPPMCPAAIHISSQAGGNGRVIAPLNPRDATTAATRPIPVHTASANARRRCRSSNGD